MVRPPQNKETFVTLGRITLGYPTRVIQQPPWVNSDWHQLYHKCKSAQEGDSDVEGAAVAKPAPIQDPK